ncbi:MAG: hypothetical protein MJ189_00605 [Coriobacteriales bacterium]|nr:hypothetical protein [Coriobacteriales bacterium]
MVHESFVASDFTIFTTSERQDYYRCIIGEGYNCYFTPQSMLEFYNSLHNQIVAGCKYIVVDERHFYDVEDLCTALFYFQFSDVANLHSYNVFVCMSDRLPGDEYLNFIVADCGIYNIIYDCNNLMDISVKFKKLLMHSNKKNDIFNLYTLPKFAKISKKIFRSMDLNSNLLKDFIYKKSESESSNEDYETNCNKKICDSDSSVCKSMDDNCENCIYISTKDNKKYLDIKLSFPVVVDF